jgi:hypothetical protein
MANNIGTLVTAPIRVQADGDPISSGYANEIQGGWHQVNSISERDNIIDARKLEGMACYVIDVSASYLWVGGSWIDFPQSSVDVSNFITTSEVASISGDLQSQIDGITTPTSATFLTDYDNRYVNVTGDTMAGDLTITTIADAGAGSLVSVDNTGKLGNTSIGIGDVATQNDLSDYVAKAGDTMTGDLTISLLGGSGDDVLVSDNNGKITNSGTSFADVALKADYVAKTGDTMSGPLEVNQNLYINENTNPLNYPLLDFQKNGTRRTSIYSPTDDTLTVSGVAGPTSSDFVTFSPSGATIHTLSGNGGEIVTLDANGMLVASGYTVPTSASFISDYDSRYTLLSTTISISGDLQSQIDALSYGGVTSIEGLTGIVDISGGSGISISTNGNSIVIKNTIEYVSAPVSPSSPGEKGQRAYSSNYVYECIDTNTWVRYAAASTW